MSLADGMRLVRQALGDAEVALAAIPGQPRQDAETLMAHALGVSTGDLHLRHLDDQAPDAFVALLERRLRREPVPYITGRAGFWTIELEVGPGVLIPRADTETLIEAAVAHFGDRAPASILDLGTGPGTLLFAALDQWPAARGIGIDASPAALAYAQRNADRLSLTHRAEVRLGDWGQDLEGSFDLILCNPPYIAEGCDLPPDVSAFEPHGALFAGAEGLDAYRRLSPDIARLLAPGGVACLELGEGQAAAVAQLFAKTAFTISSRDDLRHVERCLVLRG